MTAQTNQGTDKFDQAWASMSTADRQVILGHDRDVLTIADKIRLAKAARAVGAAQREGKPKSPRPSVGRHRDQSQVRDPGWR